MNHGKRPNNAAWQHFDKIENDGKQYDIAELLDLNMWIG